MFYDEIMEAAEFIQKRTNTKPTVGIILGSGLGELGEKIEDAVIVPYSEIPGFPNSSLLGHAERLIIGKMGGVCVAAMQGRYHFYQGFTMKQVTLPVFVMKQLGAKALIVTNACGGINESFAPGDLMLITDHLNMTGLNPLIGENDDRLGPRFPDMTEPYSRRLIDHAQGCADKLGIKLKRGVYAFFPGPCFETAAEIQAFKAMGADAVGMSTVPESVAARYLGMELLGISCITNMATGISKVKHSHEEVLATAEKSGVAFRSLVENILSAWPA